MSISDDRLIPSAETQGILEHVLDGVAVVDRDWRCVYVNAALERMLRMGRGEILGRTCWELAPTALGTAFDVQFHKAMAEQVPVAFEAYFAELRIWVEARGFPSPDALTIFVREITAQKCAEEALRESQSRQDILIRHAPAAIAMFDMEMRYLMVSDRWIRDYHLDREGVIGRTHYEVFPEITERWKAIHRRCLGGAVERCEADAFERADGSRQWVRWEIQPWFKADGAQGGILMLTDEITERKMAEEALRISEERFRTLFNTMSEGFALCEIICDGKGKPVDFRYLQVNPAFEKHTGLKAENVTGRRALEVIPTLEHWWIDVYGAVALTGQPARYEDRVVGLGRDFEVFAFSPAKGQFAVVFVDISDRIKARDALRRANEQLEEASRAKDQFLAVLSHELRTPLAPVLTTAQVLEGDGTLSPAQRESMAMIRRNVELEARLIDDLLDLTRIVRGKLELNFTTVDLHERLREVLAMCVGEMAAKQLRLTVEMGAEKRQAPGDAARLQQVLWNLLKNAMKFTPVGGSITVATHNPDSEHVAITIKDTGMGIEPELLSRLFNAFEQGGKEVTRQYGGLGLGLAISKGLVDLHGGTLVAESAGPGSGATFTLTLRRAGESQSPRPRVRGGTPMRSFGGARQVLVVEDHADTARVMASLLKSYGLGVTLARSVQEALRAVEGGTFDLMISDIGLPDGSGLDLMRQVAAARPMKAIALSGYGMEEDIRKSREAGFLAHLTKPVDLKALERTLAEILK